MRKKQRFGDPMRDIIAQKEKEFNVDDKEYFIGDDMFKIEKRTFYLPKCKFIGASNRFNINPG